MKLNRCYNWVPASIQTSIGMSHLIRILPTIVVLLAFSARLPAASAADERGAKIYAQKCAECHGERGEGTEDNYAAPLFGDQPTIDLAEYISETMPDGSPEECSGDDAKAVAEWMQSAFYSPEAQARINPPRRSLSRLTVSQYRNSIADLAAGFSYSVQPDEQRGLRARYYKSRSFNDTNKAFERIDSHVDFNFGEGTPDNEKIPKAEEFSIHWEGSVLIETTGWYEFITKTENGVRLYVNDNQTPLIDAWVKSGYDTEYRGRRFLLAGRMYRLQLHWFTFKEKTASIGLWWKAPHGVEQPIPARHLSPINAPPQIIVETPFPPDDRSDGYERGTSVSREWYEATTMAAIEAADKIIEYRQQFARLKRGESQEERRRKLLEFCHQFAYRAFRRPLSDKLSQTYVNSHFEGSTDSEDALRRSLLSILKSPRFLYREVTGEDDLYTKVSRLSYAIVDSTPDRDLLRAAEKAWVDSEKGLRDQAWRLMKTWRGRVRLQEFLRRWINLERLDEIDKDSERFADFTPELVADLRESLELLLLDAVRHDDGYHQLLSSDEIWMNDRMARFYGAADVEGTDFQKVKFESDRRAGIASHPFLLSGLAYHSTTSPIHRGVFLSRSILGRALKPPPDSVAPLAPELQPELTTRERVIKQTSPAACNNCHRMINALGFALEGFDAVGRSRKTEKDKPIDSSGHYRMRNGDLAQFNGARELADFLLKSQETHRSFVRQLFHHMVQQPILAYGPDTISKLAKSFSHHNLNMKQLVVEIAVMSATDRHSATVVTTTDN